MNDVAFLAILLAIFALLAGFVAVCDRIIGPDEDEGRVTSPAVTDAREAA